MAIISAGFTRATEDIDLLVDATPENQERLRAALLSLPDQAVRDVVPDDLENTLLCASLMNLSST